MKRMLTAVVVILTLYCAVMLLAFFGQRSLIYPATTIGTEPRVAGARLEAIACADLGTVHASYFPAPAGAATVVHFHGNGEELVHQAELVRALSLRELGVLAVEYPGYGMDRSGTATEANIYTAAECALRHLQGSLGVPARSIVLQGQSLGTGVAVEMATRGHGAGLVLISPYTSMVQMANRVLPFLSTRWLVRDRYDSLSKADGLQLPALVIHGTEDEVIPFAMGEQIAKSLTRSQLVAIEGGHHNDLFAVAEERVLTEIATFAGRVVQAP
jgi:pimeloyl-ACP methyl ester carboxylesterase